MSIRGLFEFLQLLCILFNENCSGLHNSLDCFNDILFEQVILQSETIQELTKTSQELALLQEEASELRKLADAHKSENVCYFYTFYFIFECLFCMLKFLPAFFGWK